MTIPDEPTSAIDKLASVNGNAYNAVSNPDGLAKGGHRQNWAPAANAVAAVANWISSIVSWMSATAAQVATDAASAAAGSGTEATVAAIRSGINAFYLSIRRIYAANEPVALNDAASIAWDMATGINFDVTITADGRTLANPSNKVAGKSGLLTVIQGAGGSKSITTWGADYTWIGDQPSWPTAAGALTLISYIVRPDGKVLLNWGGNNA